MQIQWEPKIKLLDLNNNQNANDKIVKMRDIVWYMAPSRKEIIPEYLVFLDLGTSNLTSEKTNSNNRSVYIQEIPDIRRMAIMICRTDHFYSCQFDSIPFKVLNIFGRTQDEFTEEFFRLHEQYHQPLFIAHYGYKFDFAILLANLIRMRIPVDNILTADSLRLFRYHFKGKLKSAKNENIFLAFQRHYRHQMYLAEKDYKGPYDRCKMMALWIHACRMPLYKYSIGLEYMNSINAHRREIKNY